MDGHREHQLFDFWSQAGQLDVDLLVIAFTLAGAVVAQVFNRTIFRGFVVVENEAGVVQNLAAFAGDEDRCIEVELGAVSYARVPAQANDYFGETWSFFGQRYVGAFGQRNSH
ncbi:hypothetical protein D3C77_398610 [compost metagenome]